MTRFYVGAGSLRILKNDADDPETTPSTAVDKFLFDSKVSNLGYIDGTFYFTTADLVETYYPAGSNDTNCLYSITQNYGYWQIQFYPDRFNSFPGHPVLITAKKINKSDGSVVITYSSDTYVSGKAYGIIKQTVGELNASYGCPIPTSDYDVEAFVWRFAIDGTSNDLPSATPVSGQESVRISSSEVKVTRPGFDVSTATGRQLIADSDNIPLKICRAGTIASLPSKSYVDINLPFAIPSRSLVDIFLCSTSVGSNILSVPNTDNSDLGTNDYDVNAYYEFINGNTTIRVHNSSNFDMRGRYMIYAGGDGKTSGSCPVLRRVSGSPDYVQLVRPGSADPPNFDDVIADTRMSYIPILASGYVPYSSFTNYGGDTGYSGSGTKYGRQLYRINVPNRPSGTKLFPRLSWSGFNRSVYFGSQVGLGGDTFMFNIFDTGSDSYVDVWQASGGWDGYNNHMSPNADLAYLIFAVPDTL